MCVCSGCGGSECFVIMFVVNKIENWYCWWIVVVEKTVPQKHYTCVRDRSFGSSNGRCSSHCDCVIVRVYLYCFC